MHRAIIITLPRNLSCLPQLFHCICQAWCIVMDVFVFTSTLNRKLFAICLILFLINICSLNFALHKFFLVTTEHWKVFISKFVVALTYFLKVTLSKCQQRFICAVSIIKTFIIVYIRKIILSCGSSFRKFIGDGPFIPLRKERVCLR